MIWKKRFNKKGALYRDYIGWLIIIGLGIFVFGTIIFILMGYGEGAINFIKDMFRFGG